MTQTATLLLFLAGELTRGEHATLDEFARKNQLALVAPTPTPRGAYPTYREDLVLDLEGRLDEARTLASSLDEERALELLRTIERDVVAHPELPQAAWLLAEHHRIAADLRRAAADGASDADRLSGEAQALEGPRVAAFGAEATPQLLAARVLVRVHDLDTRDVLELDGVSGGAGRQLEPGTHQVRVLRAGELVFASFVTLGDRADVTLGVRPLAPCSSEDLGAVAATRAGVRGTAGVGCQRYVLVRRGAGRLEVADCSRSACTAFTPLRRPPRDPDAGLPPWATVALAGAGAVATMVLLAWATGSFEPETPPEKTVFVYGGLK